MRPTRIALSIFALLLLSTKSIAGPMLLGEATVDSNWSTVSFDSSLLNPVIFTSLPLGTSTPNTITQVRAVTNDSFQVRMLNEYGSTVLPQTIDFLAVQSGNFSIGGTTFSAGTTTVTTQPASQGGVTSVSLTNSFSTAPGVLTSTQTVNDPGDAFMVSRTDNIGTGGFDVRLQTRPGTTTPNEETVGWLAFEKSSSSFQDDGLKGQGIEAAYVDEIGVDITFGALNDATPTCYDTPEDQTRIAAFGQVGFLGGDFAWLSSRGANGSCAGNTFNVYTDEGGEGDGRHIGEFASLLGFEISLYEAPASAPEPEALWLLLAGWLGLLRLRKSKIRVGDRLGG